MDELTGGQSRDNQMFLARWVTNFFEQSGSAHSPSTRESTLINLRLGLINSIGNGIIS